MMLIAQVMRHTHDNDDDTWTPLGLAAARVLETCEQEKSDREREAQRTADEKKKNEEQRAYIEQRLRDIAAFEERIRSGNTSRRKRN